VRRERRALAFGSDQDAHVEACLLHVHLWLSVRCRGLYHHSHCQPHLCPHCTALL
jgi:hypothetical protein